MTRLRLLCSEYTRWLHVQYDAYSHFQTTLKHQEMDAQGKVMYMYETIVGTATERIKLAKEVSQTVTFMSI